MFVDAQHCVAFALRLTVQAGGQDDASGHCVGVDVARWAAVLHVSLAIFGCLRGDADRGSTISDSGAELVDLGGLVPSGETHCVVLSVDGDVLVVALAELLDGGVDVLESSLRAHLLGGVVGVASGSVPVAGDGLGVEGHDDTELLSESVHDEAGDPHVVSDVDAKAGSDLVLPLAGHDLSVDTGDLDSGVQAGSVVCLYERATKRSVCSSTTVVGALGGGETSLGPAEGDVVEGEEGVLLLNSEPWLEVLGLLHDGGGGSTGVGGEWCAVGFVSGFDQSLLFQQYLGGREGEGVEK